MCGCYACMCHQTEIPPPQFFNSWPETAKPVCMKKSILQNVAAKECRDTVTCDRPECVSEFVFDKTCPPPPTFYLMHDII
jgi:hypothetical protein